MEKINAVVKHRILLADDSVTIQKVVNLTFADEGIEVIAVGDGDQAMQRFVEAVPDLVMVDVNMPGADGYRICEMIKQDDETKHIPVILLVGSFEPFDEEEARRVGADDFLTKPFQSIRQLVNKVSDLLNGKTAGNLEEGKFAGSFDDTLEMIKPVDESEKRKNFGDAAMDDEMIQTNQIGSLPVNEAQKFESFPEPEKLAETEVSESENGAEIEQPNEELTAETAPETELIFEENRTESEEIAADEAGSDEPLPRHENIYEFANEQEFEDEKSDDEKSDDGTAETKEDIIFLPEETEPVRNDSEEIEPEKVESDEEETAAEEAIEEPEIFQKEIAPEESAPENLIDEAAATPAEADETPAGFETTQEFALDDFDLLELPQSGKAKSLTAKIADTQTSERNLSPEDIEAVADRVVEKLSRETIEQIVREVVLQISKK